MSLQLISNGELLCKLLLSYTMLPSSREAFALLRTPTWIESLRPLCPNEDFPTAPTFRFLPILNWKYTFLENEIFPVIPDLRSKGTQPNSIQCVCLHRTYLRNLGHPSKYTHFGFYPRYLRPSCAQRSISRDKENTVVIQFHFCVWLIVTLSLHNYLYHLNLWLWRGDTKSTYTYLYIG